MSAAALFVLALSGQRTAIRVSYEAPAGCPDGAAFLDALQARTDRVRPATVNEAALDVSVRVNSDEHGFRGQVRETEDGNESAARTVDGETCAEVVAALSLTVALSVDPDAHAPTAMPEPEPASPPAPLPAPSAPEADGVTAAPSAAPLQLELGVAAVASELLVSDLSSGGALSGTLLRRTSASTFATVELSLLWASTGGFTANPATHRARFGAAVLDACPFRFRTPELEIAPCALAVAGVLEATGRDLSAPVSVDRAWWSAGLDLQASIPLAAGFQLQGAFGASAPFWRRRFYTTQPEQVIAETPVISPLARLGLGFRF